MTQRIIPCQSCIHYHQHRRLTGTFCDAFPDGDGIPSIIVLGRVTHRTPYPGDRGIQWEPKAEQEHALDGIDVTKKPFPVGPLGY